MTHSGLNTKVSGLAETVCI